VATNIGGNVGSYTQGRIAGDFLSSRKAAWAERYQSQTTAAGLAGSWCCSLVVLFPLLFSCFLFSAGDASPLQSQSNGQVRSVKAQKCRFEYCLFSLLSISVYILKPIPCQIELVCQWNETCKLQWLANSNNSTPITPNTPKNLSNNSTLSNRETVSSNQNIHLFSQTRYRFK